MHSNSGLFNQRMPSCKGQQLKMKGRCFSFKVLSRASFPRNCLVFVSLEEKEGARNPWDVSVGEESSHEIPKSKYARQVCQNSVWAWSGGRKAYIELTGVRKINFGPLLWQQGFFRFSHSTRQEEVSCWEEGILQSQARIQKLSKWEGQRNPGLPATNSESSRTESYLQGTHWPIFCQHSFMEKRNKEWKHITETCRPHQKRTY